MAPAQFQGKQESSSSSSKSTRFVINLFATAPGQLDDEAVSRSILPGPPKLPVPGVLVQRPLDLFRLYRVDSHNNPHNSSVSLVVFTVPLVRLLCS
jgi:hypothetical protein